MDADDFVEGGDGNDTLLLGGDDYSGQMLTVSTLELSSLLRATTTHSPSLPYTPTTCDGSALHSANSVYVNASGGDFVTLKGGAGNDALTGTDLATR